mgnify:CR=1 FL=1
MRSLFIVCVIDILGFGILIPLVPRVDSGWYLVVPLVITGCGLGLLVSQLNNYALAPIEARRQLAAYKAPKRILFVDELPRNAMGKVQKNLLRHHHQHAFSEYTLQEPRT